MGKRARPEPPTGRAGIIVDNATVSVFVPHLSYTFNHEAKK